MKDVATISTGHDRPRLVLEEICEIEQKLRALPQIDIPVAHHFSMGVYAREARIPAGALVTGHIHKYPQLNILAAGEISVLIDGEICLIRAPAVISAPAGTKRIAYAHTDVTWITVHPTNEKDIDKIEQQFIATSEDEYREFLAAQSPPVLEVPQWPG